MPVSRDDLLPLVASDLPRNMTLGTLVARRDWAPGLATFRVQADVPPHVAGQFVQLGLPDPDGFVSRAYSLSSAPGEDLETYVIEVDGGRLTSRLFALRPGDPVAVSTAPAGHFVLDRVPDARELWLVSTGTGLSPYIAMLRSGVPQERFERVVVVHGVRTAAELAYRDEILQHGATWIPVVSREPGLETLPPSAHDGARKVLPGRITTALQAGTLEAAVGAPLEPARSQVMLCGNPAMIKEMQGLLADRGLQKNRPRRPGHVTAERYW